MPPDVRKYLLHGTRSEKERKPVSCETQVSNPCSRATRVKRRPGPGAASREGRREPATSPACARPATRLLHTQRRGRGGRPCRAAGRRWGDGRDRPPPRAKLSSGATIPTQGTKVACASVRKCKGAPGWACPGGAEPCRGRRRRGSHSCLRNQHRCPEPRPPRAPEPTSSL